MHQERIFFEIRDEALAHLSLNDHLLGEVIKRLPRIKREMSSEPFVALIETIVSQQISTTAARTVWTRLNERFTITPEALAQADRDSLQAAGLSFRKVKFIQDNAKAILTKKIDLNLVYDLEEIAAIEYLSQLAGIGPWSAQMLLMFTYGREDIIAYEDLGIRRGMLALYDYEELSYEQFLKHREVYSPYGTIASLYLWEISSGGIKL